MHFRLSLLAASVFLVGAPCTATPIFTNLGLGDTYNTSVAWALISNNGAFTGATQLAAAFTPTANYRLETIRAAVGYFGTTADQTYHFAIAQDNGAGAPGTVLESYTVNSVTTGPSYSALVVLTSALHPELALGVQYWVIMTDFTNTTNSARTGRWRLNTTSASGISYYTGGWHAISNPSPAFDVAGTLVPEPSTALLFPAALGALLWFRRSR